VAAKSAAASSGEREEREKVGEREERQWALCLCV
jgi:hypothetical protein